ncbi:hypothetical protein [Staphylococcus haemolyticus]|uniref:hypothetical protein n=1 Tax=Staphylococcus haemolyticus TaxID=1283 RepID=UPI00069F6567|nr:hypothetical protein [Staphylococcus haemolyticus]
MTTKLSGSALAGTSLTRKRVDNDYYATPPESVKKLLEVESFKGSVMEPCCGEGHISELLKDKGYTVKSNDLIDRGYGETHLDFLTEEFEKVDNIITNPPYKYAKEFIEKSLKVTNKKVAMFCKIQLLEGVSRYEMFKNAPLKTVYVFSKRQNPLRNGKATDENGKKWASTMCFAWFVFEHGYQGKPEIEWLI